MPTNMINSRCCRWRVCRVHCRLYEQRGLIHTVQDSAHRLRRNLKKSTPLLLVVQFTKLATGKTCILQPSALHYICVLTPAVTTHVYKQHTAACPLLLFSHQQLQQKLTNSIPQHVNCWCSHTSC